MSRNMNEWLCSGDTSSIRKAKHIRLQSCRREFDASGRKEEAADLSCVFFVDQSTASNTIYIIRWD